MTGRDDEIGDGAGASEAKGRTGRGPRCPVCGAPTLPQFRPFCSRRCADVDLHRWLSGGYSIPVVEDDDLPDEGGEG